MTDHAQKQTWRCRMIPDENTNELAAGRPTPIVPSRVRLDDDEFVDEIRVRTIPRFKESSLSGDEWRYHVEVQFLRKGRAVKVAPCGHRYDDGKGDSIGFNRMRDAVAAIPGLFDRVWPLDDVSLTEDLCDQPGCAKPWTQEFRLTKRGCGRCGSVREAPGDYVRAFCDLHAHRGDSDLDDLDDHYALATA